MAAYSNSCAHATIINLFKLRGLEPPTFDGINEGLCAVAEVIRTGKVIGDPDAPTQAEIQTYLAMQGFLCGLLIIPHASWHEPQRILTRFLDAGCHLLLFFNWRSPVSGEIVPHITLAEGYDEQGYKVIDGEPPYYPEGTPFELEPQLPEDIESLKVWAENQTHGSRRTLPFWPVMTVDSRLGILPHVIVVYPTL